MKIAKLVILSSVCFTMSVNVFAQIGINTDNPQALFHVDARSTAAKINPATGVPSAAQQADDIVVTTAGHVGVGTIDPWAVKMEIDTRQEAGVYPIQIKDGTEAAGKVLVSDYLGNAQWKTLLPPDGHVYPMQTVPAGIIPGIETGSKVPGTEFTVPVSGFFSYEIRWWCEMAIPYTGSGPVSLLFELRKNDTEVVDHFLYETPYSSRGLTCFIPLYSRATSGDRLSLYVAVLEGAGDPGDIVTQTLHDWTTSKVLIKKLLING